MPFDKTHFEKLFLPKRIAIIGASSDSKKVGYAILNNIINAGYTGEILPVNPNAKEILGQKCYSSISNTAGNIDLAIIVVKAHLVPEALMECIHMRIDTIIVISAGFNELGTPEGKKLGKGLHDIAIDNDLLIIGPNCLGIINTSSDCSLNATFSRLSPKKGNIAFVTQSGAIGVMALEFAEKHDIGFSKFVSIGNKAVVNENDLINYLYNDPDTAVILVYLESFAEGELFRDVIKKNESSQPKPIIFLKSGRSESGKKAALSHTGALASSDAMISHFLEDCGIIRVDTLEEMFSAAMVMANQPVPAGNKLLVLTNAGGLGIMATDAAEQYGLEMAKLNKEVKIELRRVLPPVVAINNPIDLLGDADGERYQYTLKMLLETRVYNMLLIICTPQFMTQRADILKRMKEAIPALRRKKITLAAVFASVIEQEADDLLDSYDLPNYEFPELAVKALANYNQYANLSKKTKPVVPTKLTERKFNHLKKLIAGVQEQNRGYLNEIESYKMLKEYRIPVARYSFVTSLKEALVEGKKLEFPLVAKIVAVGVLHKFDIGGVVIDIKDERQLIEAYEHLSTLVVPDRYTGVLLQKSITKGIELIVGVKHHTGFGHAVMFGLGGTYVEVMQDVSFAMAPLSKTKAREMVESIKGVKLLNGYRSRPAVNKENIVKLLLTLSRIVDNFPEIKSIDLNPVFAFENSVIVADARIIL